MKQHYESEFLVGHAKLLTLAYRRILQAIGTSEANPGTKRERKPLFS